MSILQWFEIRMTKWFYFGRNTLRKWFKLNYHLSIKSKSSLSASEYCDSYTGNCS